MGSLLSLTFALTVIQRTGLIENNGFFCLTDFRALKLQFILHERVLKMSGLKYFQVLARKLSWLEYHPNKMTLVFSGLIT